MVLGPCPPAATPKAVNEYDVDCPGLCGPVDHFQAEGIRIGGGAGIGLVSAVSFFLAEGELRIELYSPIIDYGHLSAGIAYGGDGTGKGSGLGPLCCQLRVEGLYHHQPHHVLEDFHAFIPVAL